ncbi:MAG: putative hydro-lyase [Planctomycetes bacterium]|nr:putative hydro-lyase [Planctomycetota bacterium]
MSSYQNITGKELRDLARKLEFTGVTSGLALGYVQANLVVLPRAQAFDFLLFCQRNPKPCPLLDVTEVGDAEPRLCAPGADLRTDVPCYRVYRQGELMNEPADIVELWQADWVGFLLGCSFTFEGALLQAGLPVRHIEENRNVPMYRTNIACQPAGIFHGPMVVSMRPMTPAQAVRATQICTRFARAHGTPVHLGDPSAIGIRDLADPDFGDAVTIRPGEIPVFWACGVTPQAAVMQAKPPICVTHKPGHMFVTDWKDVDLESV